MEFDAEFSRKYEETISNLSEDDLEFVASLSQSRLKEYVYSPARIRPLKLKRWREEDSVAGNGILNNVMDKLFGVEKKELPKTFLDQLPTAPVEPQRDEVMISLMRKLAKIARQEEEEEMEEEK